MLTVSAAHRPTSPTPTQDALDLLEGLERVTVPEMAIALGLSEAGVRRVLNNVDFLAGSGEWTPAEAATWVRAYGQHMRWRDAWPGEDLLTLDEVAALLGLERSTLLSQLNTPRSPVPPPDFPGRHGISPGLWRVAVIEGVLETYTPGRPGRPHKEIPIEGAADAVAAAAQVLPAVPPVGSNAALNEDELAALLLYSRSAFNQNLPQLPPASSEQRKGRRVFRRWDGVAVRQALAARYPKGAAVLGEMGRSVEVVALPNLARALKVSSRPLEDRLTREGVSPLLVTSGGTRVFSLADVREALGIKEAPVEPLPAQPPFLQRLQGAYEEAQALVATQITTALDEARLRALVAGLALMEPELDDAPPLAERGWAEARQLVEPLVRRSDIPRPSGDSERDFQEALLALAAAEDDEGLSTPTRERIQLRALWALQQAVASGDPSRIRSWTQTWLRARGLDGAYTAQFADIVGPVASVLKGAEFASVRRFLRGLGYEAELAPTPTKQTEKAPSPSPKQTACAGAFEGARVVMVGGGVNIPDSKIEEYKAAFGFRRVDVYLNDAASRAAQAVKSGRVDLVILLAGFTSHSLWNKVVGAVRTEGTPLLVLKDGYNDIEAMCARMVEQGLVR